jgi:hypothetical protein
MTLIMVLNFPPDGKLDSSVNPPTSSIAVFTAGKLWQFKRKSIEGMLNSKI